MVEHSPNCPSFSGAIPPSHTTTTASTRNTLPFCRLVILKLLFAVLYVNTGGTGLQADAVPSPLLHDLRLFQLQFVDAGDHDAVARLPDVLQGPGHLVILRLDPRQLGQQAHQVAVVPHLEAGLLRKGLVEHLPGQAHPGGGHAGAQINGGDDGLTDILVLSQLLYRAVDLPNMV